MNVDKESRNVAPRLILECSNQMCLLISKYLPFLWSYIDTLLLIAVTIVRLASGVRVAKGVEKCHRPEQHLILYSCQTDPGSRLVQETLSILDLDYVCYPCPRESMTADGQILNSRYRPQLMKAGGLLKLPLLVDPNHHSKLYLADNINPYLFKTYGHRAHPPRNYTFAHHPVFRHISLFMCQLLRPCMNMGVLRAPSMRPEKPLELWGFASSPYVHRVTEVLCTLELPYVMRNVAKKSMKRKEFRSQELDQISDFSSRPPGQIQVPMLKDPNNNDLRLLESSKIVNYLATRYQTYPVSYENWLESSGEGPEFEHSTAALAGVLAIATPPLLMLMYTAAVILQNI